MEKIMSNPESVNVLQECMDLQLRKSRDYQNPNSSVKQADYYPNGVQTIYDVMHGKMLRMKSVMEAMQSKGYDPNFESLEDSAKDLINYASFFVSYCRSGIQGQAPGRDIFNKEIIMEARPHTGDFDTSLIVGDDINAKSK
jgi:hypothetical protein